MLDYIIPFLILVLVALRDDISAVIFRPKLGLRFGVGEHHGEKTSLTTQESNISLDAFYWHLECVNLRRWRIAKECNLYLESLCIENNGSISNIPIAGDILVKQRHMGKSESFDLGYNSRFFDFIRLVDKSSFEIMVSPPSPNNFRSEIVSRGKLTAEVRLIAVNATSKKYKIEAEWDGSFPSKGEDRCESVTLTCDEIQHPSFWNSLSNLFLNR